MSKKRNIPKCPLCGNEIKRIAGLLRCEPCAYSPKIHDRRHERTSHNGYIVPKKYDDND